MTSKFSFYFIYFYRPKTLRDLLILLNKELLIAIPKVDVREGFVGESFGSKVLLRFFASQTRHYILTSVKLGCVLQSVAFYNYNGWD